jgi:hypothetical protein
MFPPIIYCRVIIAFDGITINTSVQATFISSDINAFNAVADVTLVFILLGEDRITDDLFYQILINIHPLTQEEIEEMAVSFKKTIDVYPDIQLDTCTVKVDLRHLGIPSGLCIDKDLIEKIIGYPILAQKDKNQRNICNCIESIDIGTYESCLNGCIYCYAIKGNYNTAVYNRRKHDKNSPLLIGHLSEDDIVKEREMKSLRDNQYSLF